MIEKFGDEEENLIEINQENLPQGVFFLSFVTDKHQTIRKM